MILVARWLQRISIVYLGLPYLLFFMGWINLWFAIPLSLLLLSGLLVYSKKTPVRPVVIDVTKSSILISVLIIAIWVLLSGSGGYFFQNSDYSKHNAVLRDLIQFDWPVVYHSSNSDSPLIYYVAYYLPAAAIGKLFGWQAANAFLFLWTLLGVLLSTFWFQWIIQKFSWKYIILFVFFSGMDYLGNMLQSDIQFQITDHIEWWSEALMQYPSNTTLLFWVPQHALSGWLITSLLIYGAKESKYHNLFMLFGLSALWSPFITVGLVPFVVYEAIMAYKSSKLRELVTVSNVAGLVILGVSGLYLMSGSGSVSSVTGWFWESYNISTYIISLCLLYVMEFALIAFLVIPQKKELWFLFALSFMMLIPLYILGANNDLATRSVIPSLFVLLVYVANALQNKRKSLVIILILIIGSLTAINEVARSLMSKRVMADEWFSLYNAPPEYRQQYLGNSDSYFMNWVAKKNPNGGVSNPIVYRSSDLNWSIWKDDPTVTFNLQKRSIASTIPTDNGILAAVQLPKGEYLVEIKVSGNTLNGATDPASLTLFGLTKIVSIPYGDYSDGMKFYGVIHLKEAFNGLISFGLGGWGVGAGTIALEDITIYKWEK